MHFCSTVCYAGYALYVFLGLPFLKGENSVRIQQTDEHPCSAILAHLTLTRSAKGLVKTFSCAHMNSLGLK